MNRTCHALLAALVLASAACTAEPDDGDAAGRFDDQTASPPRTSDAPADVDPTPVAEPAPAAAEDPKPAEPTEPEPATQTTCRAPRDLGALSGDTGAPSTTAQGTCDTWLRLRLTEDSTGPLAGAMKLTATLVSPAGEDFDLLVYANEATDVLECTTVNAKSELPAGRSDVVKADWGEWFTANNASDSRTVSIHVKRKAGAGCSAQPWTLLLQGNI
jgi:hypothetical protein